MRQERLIAVDEVDRSTSPPADLMMEHRRVGAGHSGDGDVMVDRASGKAISAMVMQARDPAKPGAVSGLIWSDGAPRTGEPNAEGRLPGLFIEGKISGDADISVNGRIRGDIDVTSLTVDEEGMVEGNVIAEQVEVRGRVIGDIVADLIKLHPRAIVHGDLTYRRLSIEMGAEFHGGCHQLLDPPPPEPVYAEPTVVSYEEPEAEVVEAASPAEVEAAPAEAAPHGAAEPTLVEPERADPASGELELAEPAVADDEFDVPPMPPEAEDEASALPLQPVGKLTFPGASRAEKGEGLLN